MAREPKAAKDMSPAELERAARRAARQGAAVRVYVDGVHLIIAPATGAAPDDARGAVPPEAPVQERQPQSLDALQAAGIKLPRRRTGRLTLDDPFWKIEGIAEGTGPENVSGNVDKYLLEAYSDPDFHA